MIINQISIEIIEKKQEQLFGKRYIGASLSTIQDGTGEKILEFLNKKKNFLVYCGTPGCGKNYLCSALVPWILSNFDSYRIFDEYTLLEKVRKAISNYEHFDYATELKLLLDDDFIILNDIGSCPRNDWREEILFTAIDTRYNSLLPTIITSNLSRNDFEKTYHQRICSRIFSNDNIIIENMNGKDHRS